MGVAIPLAMMGASLVGGAADMWGANKANAANARMAQKQMDFQREMSNTAYQRTTEDMRKAGLNPALAYQNGGASTPTGASAQMQNTMAGARGTAQGAADAYRGMKETQADVAQKAANTDNTKAQTDLLRAQADDLALKVHAEAQAAATNARYLDETFQDRANQAHWDAETGTMKFNEASHNAEIARLNEDFWTHAAGTRKEQYEQELRYTTADARGAEARAQLLEAEIPGAENQAAYDRSPIGVADPYANRVLSTARDLVGMYASIRSGMPMTTTNTISNSGHEVHYDKKGNITGSTKRGNVQKQTTERNR